MIQSLQWAALSHDMKTPLSAIELYNSLLSEMSPDDPERPRFHAIIAGQVRRLARMTTDILFDTNPVYHFEVLDTAPLLENAVQLYRRLHPQYGFDLTLEHALPPVKGDPNSLERVLSNVLDNSIKYSSPHTVNIQGLTLKNQIRILITDQGEGIALHHQKRLFEPHYQADHTRQGHGLGLYITRQIIQAHKGALHITSKPGQGTTVCIDLPAAQTFDFSNHQHSHDIS